MRKESDRMQSSSIGGREPELDLPNPGDSTPGPSFLRGIFLEEPRPGYFQTKIFIWGAKGKDRSMGVEAYLHCRRRTTERALSGMAATCVVNLPVGDSGKAAVKTAFQ